MSTPGVTITSGAVRPHARGGGVVFSPGAGRLPRTSPTLTSGADAAQVEQLVQPARASVVVAMDIGTYGSGFNYTVIQAGDDSPSPTINDHTWLDKPTPPPSQTPSGHLAGSGAAAAATTGCTFVYPKTRSALLLRGNRGVAFGWSAVRQYCDMSEEERRDGRYALVYGTEFKLGLMDPVRAAGLPAGVSAEDAFSEFLRLMKKYILEHLRSSAATGSPLATAAARGLLRLCLTLPALWSEGAKAAVRRAAQRAGLVRVLDSEDLTLVLEPEAAALHVSIGPDATRILTGAAALAVATRAPAAAAATAVAAAAAPTASRLRPGEVFAVVDAGGGTVDITVHEIIERGGTAVLSETTAVPGVGEMWGATAIDAAFEALFRSRVGEDVFDVWRKAHPGEWEMDVKGRYWEQIKCRFSGNEDEDAEGCEGGGGASRRGPDLAPAGPWTGGAGGGGGGEVEGGGDDEDDEDEDDDEWGLSAARGPSWRVPIPPSLHAAMKEDVLTNLRVDYGLNDSIVLDCRTMKQLFRDPVFGVVTATVRQLAALAAAPQAPVERCNKVLLVGGFGSSRYLQRQLAEAVGGRLAAGGGVMVPLHPAAAVLKGAALYGLKPELIRARASRLTYGVRTAVPYEDGMPAKFWHSSECAYYSAAGFSPFVERGQLVEADEVVTHVFTPLSSEQQIAAVELWASDRRSIRWLETADSSVGDPGGGGAGAGGTVASCHKVADVQVILGRGARTTGTGRSRLGQLGGGGSEGDGDTDESDREEYEGGHRGGGGDGGAEERLIEVSLQFGRTEIRVRARDVASGREWRTRTRFAHG